MIEKRKVRKTKTNTTPLAAIIMSAHLEFERSRCSIMKHLTSSFTVCIHVYASRKLLLSTDSTSVYLGPE